MAGLVVSQLGHVPKRGETAEIDRYSFKVLRADRRRVRLLQMTINSENAVAVD
ncbi:MAG: transporter associated domain-containing protein [Gammaproteobacteria bacterium]